MRNKRKRKKKKDANRHWNTKFPVYFNTSRSRGSPRIGYRVCIGWTNSARRAFFAGWQIDYNILRINSASFCCYKFGRIKNITEELAGRLRGEWKIFDHFVTIIGVTCSHKCCFKSYFTGYFLPWQRRGHRFDPGRVHHLFIRLPAIKHILIICLFFICYHAW